MGRTHCFSARGGITGSFGTCGAVRLATVWMLGRGIVISVGRKYFLEWGAVRVIVGA